MGSNHVDRLSNMPDEVLSEILSLMPTKFAVRTSILSKRWRYKWTLVTNIDIDDSHPYHDLKILSTFVDRVLGLCKTTEIRLFRLRFMEMWVQKSSVSKWIDEAVRLNVSELDIHVILLELPLSLYTCKTLTKLSIKNYKYPDADADVLDWPTPFNLPCLKTLHIGVFSDASLSAFKLISGCPVLESLSLEIVWRSDDGEYIFNIPTLKHLKLTIGKPNAIRNKVVLNVPVLEDLCIDGWCSPFVMENFPSLVSVTICSFDLRVGHLWVEFLKGIIGARSLILDLSYSDLPDAPLPKFSNLKFLKFESGCHLKWPLIFKYLESCSELEYLSFYKTKQSCWIEPHSVPTCILKNLRTMKYENCKGREDDIQFLEFMLRYAEVLKTLTIITCKSVPMEEENRLCAKLLKCPRASRYCEIHLVGKSIDSAANC